MKIIKQIKKCELFDGFTEGEINKLFDTVSARIVKYSRGQLIAKENDVLSEVCILLEGNLIAYDAKNSGKLELVRSLVDGEYFGLDKVFASDKVLGFNVAAALDSTVLYITAESLVAVGNKTEDIYSKLINNLLCALSDRISDLENNNGYITIKGMRKKIAKLIYDKYLAQQTLTVDLGMNRNEMAKYLNVSRPSMSREMMRMRDNDGIFTFRKEIIVIKDLEALKKIAEEAE